MVKEPEIVRQPAIQKSIILGIGILSNKLVNLHEKMGIPKRTTSVLVKNVVRVRISSSTNMYFCIKGHK